MMEKNDKILDARGIYLLIDGEPLNSNLPQEASFFDLAGILAPFYNISAHDLINDILEFKLDDKIVTDNELALNMAGIDYSVLVSVKFDSFTASNFSDCKKRREQKFWTVNKFNLNSVSKLNYISSEGLKNFELNVNIFLELLSNRIHTASNRYEKEYIQKIKNKIVNITKIFFKYFKSLLIDIEVYLK